LDNAGVFKSPYHESGRLVKALFVAGEARGVAACETLRKVESSAQAALTLSRVSCMMAHMFFWFFDGLARHREDCE
jgi:hypothetical protein